MMESRSLSVLDTPHSRGMTISMQRWLVQSNSEVLPGQPSMWHRRPDGRFLCRRLATRQRHHRNRYHPVDDALDVVEVALPLRQFRQSLSLADGVVRHREREVQAPIELDVVAAGHRATHRGDE